MQLDDVCGVWSWGWNPHGQLGRDDKTASARSTDEPNYIPSLRLLKVTKIACSHHYSALITNSGDLYTWGDGGFGKLGHGDTIDHNVPKKVAVLSQVTQVACGTAHTICISKNELYTWGVGAFGALGHGDTIPHLNPTVVAVMKEKAKDAKVAQIDACGNHSACLLSNGLLYTWGMNKYGQLGNSIAAQENIPKLVDRNINGPVEAVACGEKHTIALGVKGDLFAWGNNEFGQLGFTSSENQFAPQKVKLSHSEKPRKICCGSYFSTALTSENKTFTWGLADNGQLGHIQATYTATDKTYAIDTRNKYAPKLLEAEYSTGITSDSNSKKSVKFGELKLETLSCGNNHSAGIAENGKLWTWGWDKHGELGFRTDAEFEVLGPRLVETVKQAHLIACGGYHTLLVIRGKYVAIQLAVDDQPTELKELLNKIPGVISVVDDENGYTLLHWAAYLGHIKIIKELSTVSKFRDLLSSVDHCGRTPLHLAAMRGHAECAAEISRLVSVDDMNTADETQSTALHYAVKNCYLDIAYTLISRGAEAKLLDDNGKSALFYCENLRDAFELKLAADIHDVTVIAQSDSYEFARKLASEIEVYHVRCFLPVPGVTTNISTKLTEGKCVLFIVSDASAKSAECLDQLQAAKKANKAIFSVWFHKPKLESTIESLIFRRQLVDFSDSSKFNDSISGLMVGLKKIVSLGEIEEEAEEVAGDATLELVDQADLDTHAYVFLVFDKADKQAAADVEQVFTNNEIKTMTATESLQHNSKNILHCAACVIILSAESLASKKVHDQVALAENHKKPLFPLFLENSLNLDPATQYTLAEAPKFYFTPICLSQLASALLISFKIMHHRTSLAQHALHPRPSLPASSATTSGGSATSGAPKEQLKKEGQYWSF